MLLLPCPWCGPRDEVEFRYGGQAGIAYPPDPDALSDVAGPVAIGLSTGHTDDPFVTVPLGVRARLTCGPGARLEVLEASVS